MSEVPPVIGGQGGSRRKGTGSVRGRGSQSSALLKDGPAPPDKAAYEDKIKEHTCLIDEKEKLIKHTTTDNTDLSAQMRAKGEEMEEVEAERVKVNQEVRKVEQNIKRLGDEVAKEKDSAYRQAVELRFRSESSYDQHIVKLQRQLQAGVFHPDDRLKVKLESEIQNLKLCKIRLREYLAAKSKIDSKVDEQDMLRKRRDSLYCERKKFKEKVVNLRDAQEVLRQRMDDRKGKQKELKAEQEELRREIDLLYKQRRELRESFMHQQQQYSEAVRKVRQALYDQQREASRLKDEERKMAREARKQQKEAEKELKREHEYDEEVSTCRALISFLKSVTHVSDVSTTESSLEGVSTGVAQASPVTRRAEEEWIPAGGKKKSRKEKKRSLAKVQHKNLHLTPTTLYQFSQLRMSPPFNVSQIPTVLEDLNCKLKMYEAMNRAQSEAGDSGIGMCELNEASNGGLHSGEQTPTCTNHEKSDSVSSSPCSSPLLVNTTRPKPQEEPAADMTQTIIPEPASVESHPSTTVSS